MATIIESKKDSSGFAVRIQQRGKAFDVIRSTGFCWKYVAKQVSQESARNTFFLLTVDQSQP